MTLHVLRERVRLDRGDDPSAVLLAERPEGLVGKDTAALVPQRAAHLVHGESDHRTVGVVESAAPVELLLQGGRGEVGLGRRRIEKGDLGLGVAIATPYLEARFVGPGEPPASTIRGILSLTVDQCREQAFWPIASIDEPEGALQLLFVTGPFGDRAPAIANLADLEPVAFWCVVVARRSRWSVVDVLWPSDGIQRLTASRTQISLVPALAQARRVRRRLGLPARFAR